MSAYRSSKAWQTPHILVYETNAIKVLQFSEGFGTPILVVPPQAGHHSNIADYGPGQSLIESAVNSSSASVFTVEWKSCTYVRRNENIEDLLQQLGEAIYATGNKATLIGLCQGGWLAAIYAALYPAHVESLVIAGAPIDTKVGKSSLHKAVKMPMLMYRSTVMMGFGLMPGHTMLQAWKSSNMFKHYVKRYINPSAETNRFYKWYDHTQDLAGGWYLWAIRELFKKNKLGKNALYVGKKHVDLHMLQKLNSVRIVTGKKDDISPAEQSLALNRYVMTTAYEVDAGHIGVFMSRRGIREIWNPLFAEMNYTTKAA